MAAITTTVKCNPKDFVKAMRTIKGELVNLQSALSIVKDGFNVINGAIGKFTAVADLGGELKSLSAQTGQSVQDLVLLRQAFQNVSLSADQVPVAVAKLQKALGGISEEGVNTAEAFRRLGTNSRTLKDLSFTEQLQVMSNGFSNVKNAAERSAIAQQIFGKSGAQMLAVFEDKMPFSL